MARLLAALLAVIIAGMIGRALPTHAQPGASVAWVESTRGVAVALDAADNVYTVDYEQQLGAEMVLTKRNANGALLWTAFHDQIDPTAWERAAWVTVDRADNPIVCGTRMSGYSNPVEAASIVIKFDAAGNLLWRRVYESDFDGSSVKKCLADSDNNVYVLGMGSGPDGRVAKVKKFAPDGTALWSYFDSAGIGAAVNFKFTPDGALVIIGKSLFGSLLGYAKIDRDGNQLWSFPGVSSLTVGDAAGDAFGNTYLVHGEYVINGGAVVKKLNPAGTLIWEQVYGLSGFRIEVGSDHQAVVSGFPSTGAPGAAFIKVGADGALLWSNLDADGPQALLAHAHMLLDAQNNAYLAAGTMSAMAVCKVNSDGTAGWTETVPFGYAQAIALGRQDGSVYVVGGTTARISQGHVPTAVDELRVGASAETPWGFSAAIGLAVLTAVLAARRRQ